MAVLDKQHLSHEFADQTADRLAKMKADAEAAADKTKQMLAQIEMLSHTIHSYTEITAIVVAFALLALLNIRFAIGGLALYSETPCPHSFILG